MSVQQVDRYEIIEEVGRGAMGVVYKARDPLIERMVAIKTIHIGAARSSFEQDFYREAKSAGNLNHSNIVIIHDVGKSRDFAYIAMEFLHGQSLKDIIESGVVLSVDRITGIVAQIADGLAFAHQHSIVHRDIKPANIMVLENGVAKITDFGIALLPTGDETPLQSQSVYGSPQYVSPEQVLGEDIDGRSDIFSLGAILYELLTGLPPFSGGDLDSMLHQVINQMPPAPSSRNRRIPTGLDLIVARAMAKNPRERYPNAQQLAFDLRNLERLAKRQQSTGNTTYAAEKRVAPRKPLRTTAILTMPGSESDKVRTIDLSTGGLCIGIPHALDIGQKCMVAFDMMHCGKKRKVNAVTRVTHCIFNSSEGCFKVGLQFVDIDSDSAIAVTDFMKV